MIRHSTVNPTTIILFGVAGSGKSTLGKALACEVGGQFLDADDYHDPENKDKMGQGIPLDDRDREAWLERIHQLLVKHQQSSSPTILACSALKEKYRKSLSRGLQKPPLWILLTGPSSLLQKRLQKRSGHFVGANLLESQVKTLEIPDYAVQLDIRPPISCLIKSIQRHLK